MTTRVQALRSSTSGTVPATNSRLPGELWTNFPDLQMGVIDASKVAQRLIAVRYFSTTANYAIGDFVVQAGALYVATAAVTPGAFNAANWSKLVNAVDAAALPYLPLAGGSVTGLLILPNNNQVQIRGAAGSLRNLIGGTAASARWNLTLGDSTAEAGANAGSNFSLQAYSDAGGFLSTPLAINRATGVATFGAAVMLSGPPTLPLQAATKAYVDSGAFVPIAGGTMTGPLTLAANPAAPLQPATKQYVDALPVAMNDNRIINGDMRIDQRNSGATGTAQGYTIDRWLYSNSTAPTGRGTWQRQSGAAITALGFPYFLAFLSSSAYASLAGDAFHISQPIEADMVSDFVWGTANAQPVTLSFWVYSSLTGTFSGAIRNAPTPSTRSYPFTFSIPAASTWTKIVLTIPGDTAGTWVMSGNAAGLYLHFDLGSGANFRGPANAWASGNYVGANGAVSVVGTNGATFNVTGVKLEIGSVATPYNRQSLAKSLADCQRYFCKPTNQLAVAGYGPGAASLTIFAPRTFPVTMRAAPTQAGAAFSGLANCNTPTQGPISVDGAQFNGVNTAAGVFQFVVTGGTETYSAEL
jgi:hypothetical protein